MLLGAFFSLAAFLLLSSLYSSWKQIGESNHTHGHKYTAEENSRNTGGVPTIEPEKADFVRYISSLLSWVLIVGALVYFTVFRYKLIGIDISYADLSQWLKP